MPYATPEDVLAELVPEGQCKVWPHGRTAKGYGQVRVAGRWWRVHRLVYEHLHGPLQPGEVVRHSCDNPPCAEGSHLLGGTPADNTTDRDERGRAAVGEAHPRALLTEAAVRAIRASTGTQAEVAAQYGVDRSVVGRIRSGVAWAHVH